MKRSRMNMPGRVVTHIIFLLAACSSLEVMAVEQPVTCAVICDPSLKDSPLAALLQEKLSGGPARGNDTESVTAICMSNYYGVVCVTSIGEIYQVTFPGLPAQ